MSSTSQVNTSLSAPPAPILMHLSPASLEQVSKLITQKVTVETPYFFPIAFISLFFILYLLASLLHNLVLPLTLRRQWSSIKSEHRRTMVIYILQILFTSTALILQLSVLPLLNLNFSVVRLNVLRASACLLAALYLFELVYRYRMTYPMIFHHLITCFAMSLSLVMLERLSDPSYALTGLLWIFQATTEQTVFAALFMYRLSAPVRILGPLFGFSAIQSLVFKFASIAATIWVWVKYQKPASAPLYYAWDALYWICTVGLAFTQVWGAWVVWNMGNSLEKRYKQKQEQEQDHQVSNLTPVLTISHGQSSQAITIQSSRSASSQFTPDFEKPNPSDLESGAKIYAQR
ncbi:uncharacterized protein MEPE_06473 [Melanopsichium pennsylvanicum]|uniref:Uncharacterized protein n=2 Tax=Melanopsichium pennsylvanicum TaxID=63383 RepID=A0AAJ4XTL4_9BASI|nr:conserved hypothetical protein [Melanopsichium pennsylvanicum 4]SNX87762.1 uncharacterized protein MEPE_06473 [Melanopsichium pennsylvanicum]